MRAEESMIVWDKLKPALADLSEAAINSDTSKLYYLLSQLVPEYKPIKNEIDNLDTKNVIE